MSKTAGTTKSTSTTGLPGFQQPYIEDIFGQAKNLYNSPGPQFFPGSTIAQTNPAETAGYKQILDSAGGASDLAKSAIPAYGQLLNATNVAGNPYVTGMADAAINPIFKQLKESILPGIRQGAVAGGTRGGSRESLTAGQAIGDASRAAMDTRAGIFGNAYGQGLQAQSNAVSQLPSLQNSLMAPGYAMTEVGGAQRDMSQQNINEQIARWQHDQSLPYQKLTEYANLIRTPTGGTSSSEVVGTPPDSTSQTISLILSGLAGVPGIIKIIKDIFGGG